MLVSKFLSIRPSRDRPKKMEMLVSLCFGAYGREWGFWPSCLIGRSEQKIISDVDFVGPKQNFYSLTVCTLEQYLKNGSEKTAQ